LVEEGDPLVLPEVIALEIEYGKGASPWERVRVTVYASGFVFVNWRDAGVALSAEASGWSRTRMLSAGAEEVGALLREGARFEGGPSKAAEAGPGDYSVSLEIGAIAARTSIRATSPRKDAAGRGLGPFLALCAGVLELGGCPAGEYLP
jgi:hypothetical protein